ncbi:hypothetical protein [uncultured Tateyamaria sp.]|uniref:hypothetical protein n=1 Tax=Tateyamaria sp. 1078 TaxID=3417464 RepID=UPI00260949F2|nr:hypothetical protein [uncultured Tateyamaria sp.]
MTGFVVDRLEVDQALSETNIGLRPNAIPAPVPKFMQASDFELCYTHGRCPHMQASLRQRDMRIRVAL